MYVHVLRYGFIVHWRCIVFRSFLIIQHQRNQHHSLLWADLLRPSPLNWQQLSVQRFFYINLRLRLKVRWTFLYIRQDTLIQCSGYRIAVKKLQSATSVICSTERTLLQNLSEYKQHWSPVHLSRKKESANFSKTTVSRQNHATDSFTSGSVLPPPKFI